MISLPGVSFNTAMASISGSSSTIKTSPGLQANSSSSNAIIASSSLNLPSDSISSNSLIKSSSSSIHTDTFSLLNLPNELILEVVSNINSENIKNLIEVFARIDFVKPLLLPALISAIKEEFGERGHLCWASSIGDVKWVKAFLKDGFKNDEGCEVLQGVLNGGGFIHHRLTTGWTALHAAAMGGHEIIARILIFHGADIEATYGGMGTPLQCAALSGHLEIVVLLVNRGANVYSRSCGEVGDTALHQAAIFGHEDIIKFLLNSGFTNTNIPSTFIDGRTALHWAVINGHEETVKVLLEHGADPNEQDFFATNSLHEAAYYVSPLSKGEHARLPKPNEARITIINLLLMYGADILLPDASGTTALHIAAQFGHDEMVAILMDYEDCLDYQNEDYETALHKAAEFGHTKLVKMLLNRGAETQMVRMDGLTALSVAQRSGHIEAANLLQDFELSMMANDLSLDS